MLAGCAWGEIFSQKAEPVKSERKKLKSECRNPKPEQDRAVLRFDPVDCPLTRLS